MEYWSSQPLHHSNTPLPHFPPIVDCFEKLYIRADFSFQEVRHANRKRKVQRRRSPAQSAI